MQRLVLLVVKLCVYFWHTGINAVNVKSNSEFSLPGDYLLGGLFPVHKTKQIDLQRKPEVIQCSKYDFFPEGYNQFQVMRFAVEEINNSTSLLPGVTLGYEIYDLCSSSVNIRAVLDFLSDNSTRSVPFGVGYRPDHHLPKVLSVIGPSSSTEAFLTASMLMTYLVPLISHSASSMQLSDKARFPSFIRTIPSDKNQVDGIVLLLLKFNWRWIALLGTDDDYSQDGIKALNEQTREHGICVAYENTIPQSSSAVGHMLRNIVYLNVKVVVVFATGQPVTDLMRQAIASNVGDIVWVASEAWSLSQSIPKMPGISRVGTVLGMAVKGMALSGFDQFIQSTRNSWNGSFQKKPSAFLGATSNQGSCNQHCPQCSEIPASAVQDFDSTFSFSVYSAVYAVAHALHRVLKCDGKICKRSEPVFPHQILQNMKEESFTLNGRTISFDKNGDPPPQYEVVFWDTTSQPVSFKRVGSYASDSGDSGTRFVVREEDIKWHASGQIPVALGSKDCIPGFKKTPYGIHTCCFNCEPCTAGTFVNQSDPYTCQPCPEDEWSDDESAFCQKRTLEYLDYNDHFSIGLLVCAGLMCTVSVAVAIVFAVHHDTPVVKSSGGKMCFFMLGCLGVSCLSISCFFGVPTTWKCILRNPVFAVLFTACLCCLSVRTFQVICVFKIAAKNPKVYEFWVKKNGQWMFVTAAVGLQIFMCGLWVGIEGPHPFNDTQAVRGQIIYDCGMGNMFAFTAVIAFVGLLSVLCFAFSYFGKDLPKDYNEAKYVTYSLLVFFFTWVAYLTAYVVYSGKYIPLINAISVLASLASILVGYFIPKCYVILFKPEYNTTAHFQTCIQNYTKTISSK